MEEWIESFHEEGLFFQFAYLTFVWVVFMCTPLLGPQNSATESTGIYAVIFVEFSTPLHHRKVVVGGLCCFSLRTSERIQQRHGIGFKLGGSIVRMRAALKWVVYGENIGCCFSSFLWFSFCLTDHKGTFSKGCVAVIVVAYCVGENFFV